MTQMTRMTQIQIRVNLRHLRHLRHLCHLRAKKPNCIPYKLGSTGNCVEKACVFFHRVAVFFYRKERKGFAKDARASRPLRWVVADLTVIWRLRVKFRVP
jgi:hypothetical protein